MGKSFKINPKREKAWEDWSDDVLSQGKISRRFCMYEAGHYNWCIELDNGMQRFCRNMPEHIQRKLGVAEEDIIENIHLHGSTYWSKKAHAERDAK